ncbi:MAG: hypothetical protein H6510_08595 [Acidobacteria bacterium]|nr:hypothetical protein [Acidobacteriota bacterium]MCB9397860.1 hypothetical protein [Acidobacteriota bacterium]
MLTLFLFVFCWQDEIVSENLDATSLSSDFEQAMVLYNSAEREKAKPILEKLVQKLENRKNLDEEASIIYVQSLQWLGVIGYPAETDPYFEKIVRFDPNYEMGGQRISPKIVNHFTNIKARMVGSIRFLVSEADGGGMAIENATIWVDGQAFGLLKPDKTQFKILVGDHTVEVNKANYEPLSVSVKVQPGTEAQVRGTLIRKDAELQFVTVPNDVKIYFQDQLMGTTEGTAPPILAERLMRQGLTPSQASDLFNINNISTGEYIVRFEKPCYKSKTFKVEVNKIERRTFEPVIMEPAIAYLDVSTARPTSGIVYLDQERIGSLPISAHQVCPGAKTLRVQFTDGVFVRDLVLEEGQTTQVIAEPLPSLVWFGIEEKEGERPTEDVESWFRGLKSWNFRKVNPNDTRQVPHDPFDLFFNTDHFNLPAAEILNKSVGADLYVTARVVRKKVVIRYLEVAFWSPISPNVRTYAIDFRELDKLKKLLSNMDQPMPLTKAWLGVQSVRVRDAEGCQIVAVHEKGPLSGKVREGDIIKSCNGTLLENPAQLNRLTAGKEAILEVNGNYIKVSPVPTIAELPFDPAEYCPPGLIARLEKTSKYSPDPLIRESARFNQARFQFFSGDFQQAFDIFSTFKLDHPYGIGQGTLHFYQGLCFRKLNLLNESTASFREAAKYPHATLFDADGPSVAFWAETQLQE